MHNYRTQTLSSEQHNLWLRQQKVIMMKKHNHFAKCCEDKYVNYDCTTDDTFEGVRAQDIPPLLLGNFSFRKFVGHGNIIDIFIDRIYGKNFSPVNPSDQRFIDLVENLNTSLIDSGRVKPTAMLATLTKFPCTCNYSKWLPQFSLREVHQVQV